MKTKDFFFELPEELIAQTPPRRRGTSRLLVLDRMDGTIHHSAISDLLRWVDRETLVVLNDTKVRKARIYAQSDTGGRVEFLLLADRGGGRWLAMAAKAKRQRVGKGYTFEGGVRGRIMGVEASHRVVLFDPPIDEAYLEKYGRIPLPPYIRRKEAPEDSSRYQTVYSEKMGSAAAPTAGLHLTLSLIEELERHCAGVARVTLHVGPGTFLPVRAARLGDHKMHTEPYEITGETADRINRAKAEGKRLLAVGTTSVRTLESSFQNGGIQAGRGATDLFIHPGYKFKVVDSLLTNFHTPESSLLMLVAAFAGRKTILDAYAEAIKRGYRFFSYGDAMLIR